MQRRRKEAAQHAAKGVGSKGHNPVSAGLTAKRVKRQKRGFAAGTALFVLAVAIYCCILLFGGQTGRSSRAKALTLDDVETLKHVTSIVRERATVSDYTDLMDTTMHLSSALEQVLVDMSEEKDERTPRGTPKKRVSEEVLRATGEALQDAADVSLEKLRAMLLKVPGADLAEAPKQLMRPLFFWIASTAHAFTAALPEYYLHTDDTTKHAASLVRAINLLDWMDYIPNPSFFNWTTHPCQSVAKGASAEWIHRCETTLASRADARTRMAALFEELIALYPSYGPLRQHYLTTLILREDAGSAASHTWVRLVRNDIRRIEQYVDVCAAHTPLLYLLEAYTVPLEDVDTSMVERVSTAIAYFPTCSLLMRPLDMTKWPGDTVLQGEARPLVMGKPEVEKLLAKLKLVLGPDSTAVARLSKCVG